MPSAYRGNDADPRVLIEGIKLVYIRCYRGYGLVVECDLPKVETGVSSGYWEPGFAGARVQDLLRFFLKNPKGVQIL